jgi:hypothetical protein
MIVDAAACPVFAGVEQHRVVAKVGASQDATGCVARMSACWQVRLRKHRTGPNPKVEFIQGAWLCFRLNADVSPGRAKLRLRRGALV